MKSVFIATLGTLALGACSSGGGGGTTTGGSGTTSGGGGTTTGGPTVVTFTTVEVHPAAVAALNAAGFPVPSIANSGYVLALDGVSVNLQLPDPIVLTDAGVAPITSVTGPYSFELSDAFFMTNAAQLGVIGVIRPAVSRALGDGGLPQPTCAAFATLRAGLQDLIADGGQAMVPAYLTANNFNDYLIDTGLEVGGEAVPPAASVPDAIAYAIPMSYAVMLNCAGNPSKVTRDTDIGEAVVYVTNGTGPGLGTPVSGVVTPIKNANGNPPATYYQSDYATTDSTGTDSTGIATFLGNPRAPIPPTITIAAGASGLTFTAPYGISTQPNAFFSIVAYPH